MGKQANIAEKDDVIFNACNDAINQFLREAEKRAEQA